MRTNLQVPFDEKDEAKRLGARWDPAKRVWYVQNREDLTPFARWLSRSPAASSGRAAGGQAVIRTGARYVPLDCDCLPWEGCPKCREALQSRSWDAPVRTT